MKKLLTYPLYIKLSFRINANYKAASFCNVTNIEKLYSPCNTVQVAPLYSGNLWSGTSQGPVGIKPHKKSTIIVDQVVCSFIYVIVLFFLHFFF